ncbi:MAG: GH36-type glycosyl hydrolase domain-containing protein [Oscillospiraceae bacterium]|jgi:cyclic beta-1,2-glucan synthetase
MEKQMACEAEREILTQRAKAARALPVLGFRSADALVRNGKRQLRCVKQIRWRLMEWDGKEFQPAIEWLLDNWYLAQQEGASGISAMRHAGKLRETEGEDGRRLPLLRALADEWLGCGAGLTPENLVLFLQQVQETLPLSEKERALFLQAVRLSLLSRLEELCRALQTACGEKETGDLEGGKEREETARQLERGMERIFTGLRLLSTTDFSKAMEQISLVEQILRQDPAGVYPKMDESSRIWYRQAVCRLAKKEKQTEQALAQRVIDLAGEDKAHVGVFLFQRPLGKPARERTGVFYVGSILIVTLFLALLVGFVLGSVAAALLILLPAFEIVKNSVDFLVLHLVRPRPVFRLSLKDGVPKEGRTLCVISTLLTGESSGAACARRLEEYRLANRDAGEELRFGILADLPDSPVPMGKEQRGWVREAQKEVDVLNERYGGGFYLFSRTPVFHPVEERYMGKERKRGAIGELMRLLKERKSELKVYAGDKNRLAGTRYVITLDEDTRLNVGAARELIGAMLHPLNRAKIDTKRKVVSEGYGILQPRISVELEAANRSHFSRIFAGQGGVDPYGSTTSDVYHDLFDRGIYTGKGILDVEAFSQCLSGRFPPNCILSHDLLEGSYLRAGLIGDVELTDGYPYKVTSYFARLHRWIRGDWQVSPWLRGRVRTIEGEERNPISSISKWEIWDNLRRSVTPVFTFLALLLGMIFSQRVLSAAAGAAILSAMSNLLLSGADLAFRRGAGMRQRYHSTIITGFGGVVLQTLVQLLFLPYQAYIALSAVLTALYRMLISKRNLLAWVTAADAERQAGSGLGAVYRRMFPSVLLGAVALLFSAYPAGSAVGLVWMLSPFFAWAMSRTISEKRTLDKADRAFLLHEATLMWRYFTEHLRPEDHFLPPDNVQEQPPLGVAHRTSPTNIGLSLLCCMAALDLDLAPKERVLFLLDQTLSTVERLETWNGHLCNWYHTETLSPLCPKYISTVDSGNLCGCLLALSEGLKELGEEGTSLSERAEALAYQMDFRPLYDKERKLFSIGYDLENECLTEGFYDLMASEARQTSYLAVALGQVEARHWRRLSRAMVSVGDYSGIVSWTGTMFEYLMPHLLLPCYPNSLLYESAGFCVYAQKRRTAARGIPWGISESAFYAFDGALNYQYKAHGVQQLALKRNMNQELVLAPYASFLALLVAPESATKNLRRLRDLGIEGKYGLYEAVDYTGLRQVNPGGFEVVRTYMAHHLGMSLLSVANVLKKGVFQDRLMQNRSMAAYRELLQEKVPVGAQVMKNPVRDVPERIRPFDGVNWNAEGSAHNVWNPLCTLLSNGVYTVFVTETGCSLSRCGPLDMTRFSYDPMGEHMGISMFLRKGDQLISLTPAPYFEYAKYDYQFDGTCAQYTVDRGDVYAKLRISVPQDGAGELREVTVSSAVKAEWELICYFEPVLAKRADYEAHPAFSKLSLSTQIETDGVLVTRKPKDREPEWFLSLLCQEPGIQFDTNRAAVLGRGGSQMLDAALRRPPRGTQGEVLDPCVLARLPLSMQGGETRTVRFSLAAGKDRLETLHTGESILALPPERYSKRFISAMHLLELSQKEATEAMGFLSALVFPPGRRMKNTRASGQHALWPYGISGDLPIVTMELPDESCVEAALSLFRQYRLITINGMFCDLVFLLSDGGDYRRPIQGALLEGIKAAGCEALLGCPGGVHIFNLPKEEQRVILALSTVVLPETEENKQERERDIPPVRREKKEIAPGPVHWRYLEDRSVSFETGAHLPPLAWSHIVANPAFGWTATDAGTGNIWRGNARENQLLPWNNDPLAVEGPEGLFLLEDGEKISLFADGDGRPCKVTYGFGFAVWEKQLKEQTVKVTGFVPPNLPVRVFLIEGEGALHYHAKLRMGAGPEAEPYVTTQLSNGVLTARNSYNMPFSLQTMVLAATDGFDGFTCDWRSMRGGEFDGKTGNGQVPCFGVSLSLRGSAVLVLGCPTNEQEKRAVLSLKDPSEALCALGETKTFWDRQLGGLTVHTGEPYLDAYLNGWALYQTIACRLWGRSSLYQNGGAYGFRDQLQDVCALTATAPQLARRQILLACAHQFEEGDVQHWWHPEDAGGGADKGVRTRYTDDLLWLPYAICRYVEQTGDTSVLSLKTPYLTSPVLRKEEVERYETPRVSMETGTVLEHGARALERAFLRGVGKNGLALFGGGDWNDGMNRVGAGGTGESVWLTWFLAHVAEQWAALSEQEGNGTLAEVLRERAEALSKAASEAWDGGWFLRGYYDDGTPLGSRESVACQIDSIAQSFGALSSFSDKEKVREGLRNAVDRLFDRSHQMVKLFTPPFQSKTPDPGYITGYPAGVRENGGQYTHGAIWLAMGCLKEGLVEEGADMLLALLPGRHPAEEYLAEPYVIAADVYANPAHMGRGGWSWYTGAAGWYYRVAIEEFLGIRVKAGYFTVCPRLPESWSGFEARWKTDRGLWEIVVRKGAEQDIKVDGVKAKENAFPLAREGVHRLEITLADDDASVPATSEGRRAGQKTDPQNSDPDPEAHLPARR